MLGVLRRLGHGTVAEAATEVIARGQAAGEAEPWAGDGFVDAVVALQREWQEAVSAADLCFFDRSPVCTLALSRYLGRAPSVALRAEIERIQRTGIYERRVLFLANLGFIEPTAARRISFEDALEFEEVHRKVYSELGFELFEVGVAAPEERAGQILTATGAGLSSARPPSAGCAS